MWISSSVQPFFWLLLLYQRGVFCELHCVQCQPTQRTDCTHEKPELCFHTELGKSLQEEKDRGNYFDYCQTIIDPHGKVEKKGCGKLTGPGDTVKFGCREYSKKKSSTLDCRCPANGCNYGDVATVRRASHGRVQVAGEMMTVLLSFTFFLLAYRLLILA